MTKSASDKQVEDVLSSVRRLVSSELPRNPRPEVSLESGALVLTQADRIEEAASKQPKSRSLEERIAELEAAVGGENHEFEPDGSEDQEMHRPNRIVYTPAPPDENDGSSRRRSSQRLSQITLIETGPANDDDDIVEDVEAAEDQDAAPMAVDVPTERRESAEVRAFTDPDDVVRNIEARIASGRPISEPLPPEMVEPSDDKAKQSDVSDQEFENALTSAVLASRKNAKSEVRSDAQKDRRDDVLRAEEFSPGVFVGDYSDPEVTAGQMLADDDEPETPEQTSEDSVQPEPAPDTLSDHDPSDEEATVEPEVGAEESASAELEPNAEEPATALPEPSAAPVAETKSEDAPEAKSDDAEQQAIAAMANLSDEDAMRLLISRMLRDELQGELGERITRNVRKLVRREIKRALSSEKLT